MKILILAAVVTLAAVACSNGVQNTAGQATGSTAGTTRKNIPVAVAWKGISPAKAAVARSLDPSVSTISLSVFDAASGASEGSGNLSSLGTGNGFGGTIVVNETGPVVFEASAYGSGGNVIDVARSNYTVTGTNDSVTLAAGPATLQGGSIQGQMLSLSTVVSTIAGSWTISGHADNSIGTSATFKGPYCITTDGANLYVADCTNNEIRKISLASPCAVTTIAGSYPNSGHADNSTGTSATFNSPVGITTDGTNLYVVDLGNNEIRKISLIPPYAVTTIAGSTGPAGSADNVTGTSATFMNPGGITISGMSLYVADSSNNEIRKISLTPPYAVTTIAGTWIGLGGHADNSTGTSATFYNPLGITTDGTNLYVVDNGNNEIRKISLTPPYAVTTIAGSYASSGHVDNSSGASASFNFPKDITTDGANLFVADSSNAEIRKISLTPPYAVTTIAGLSTNPGFEDGTGTAASFDDPEGITTDGNNLYVSDVYSNNIRKIQ